jgi:hypothetical protein
LTAPLAELDQRGATLAAALRSALPEFEVETVAADCQLNSTLSIANRENGLLPKGAPRSRLRTCNFWIRLTFSGTYATVNLRLHAIQCRYRYSCKAKFSASKIFCFRRL